MEDEAEEEREGRPSKGMAGRGRPRSADHLGVAVEDVATVAEKGGELERVEEEDEALTGKEVGIFRLDEAETEVEAEEASRSARVPEVVPG